MSQAKHRIPRELRTVVRAARDAGWRERPLGTNGILFYPANGGRPIAVHTSAGRWAGRAVENALAQFRAGGLDA